MTRFITVTSGKGGVGKTNVSANIALRLAELGHKTCLFDADFGLANINILFKLYPELTLKDVILDNMEISDVLIENYNGIDIIPGSSGVEEMANLSPEKMARLISSFSQLTDYDFFIIDTAAGVSQEVISFCMAASEIILVITPDPTSLTDAYALLKILSLNGFKDPVKVIINQSPNIEVSKKVLTKLATTTHKFLSIKLQPIGSIGKDPYVVTAVETQKPFIHEFPKCPASKSIGRIAENIVKNQPEAEKVFQIETFWDKCLNLFKLPLKSTPQKPAEKETAPEKETEPSERIKTKKNIFTVSPESREKPETPTIPAEPPVKAETAEDIIRQTSMALKTVVEEITALKSDMKSIRTLVEFIASKQGKEEGDAKSEANGNEIKNSTIIDELARELSGYSMFQTLEDFEIRDIVSKLKLKAFKKGEIIIKKGDPGQHLFIIVKGMVEVTDDHGTVLDTLGHSEVFGEMSLISGDPVNANINVVEPSKLLYLNGRDFTHVLHKYPPLQMYFARLLSKRLAGRLQKADMAKSELLESGLTGKLSETPISEILQMLNMGQKTGQLLLQLPKGKAAISFNNGNLVHADYDGKADQEAFFEVLTEKEGHFRYTATLPPDHDSKPQLGHFMRMLMEGLSIMDEKKAREKKAS